MALQSSAPPPSLSPFTHILSSCPSPWLGDARRCQRIPQSGDHEWSAFSALSASVFMCGNTHSSVLPSEMSAWRAGLFHITVLAWGQGRQSMGLRSRGRMYHRLPEGAWEAGDCDGENQRHHVEAEGVPNSALALYSSLLCRWSQMEAVERGRARCRLCRGRDCSQHPGITVN